MSEQNKGDDYLVNPNFNGGYYDAQASVAKLLYQADLARKSGNELTALMLEARAKQEAKSTYPSTVAARKVDRQAGSPCACFVFGLVALTAGGIGVAVGVTMATGGKLPFLP